jgi:hypothetical protein
LPKRVARRVVETLDSKLVNRVSAALTIIGWAGLGVGLVAAAYLALGKIIGVGGWIPVAAFAVWALLTGALTVALLLHRSLSSLSSPLDRVVISSGLAGDRGRLVDALRNAETIGRAFIAETAMFQPVNNQAAAVALVQEYREYEDEIAVIVAKSDLLDARWSAVWAHHPTWAPPSLFEAGFCTRAMLDKIENYMAFRTRDLKWMMDFLETGDERDLVSAYRWTRYSHADEEEAVDRRHDPLGPGDGEVE